MNDDNINDYVPSIINPRTNRKTNGNLTQCSYLSKRSLSLKKNYLKLTNNNNNNKENLRKKNIDIPKENSKDKERSLSGENVFLETNEINNTIDNIEIDSLLDVPHVANFDTLKLNSSLIISKKNKKEDECIRSVITNSSATELYDINDIKIDTESISSTDICAVSLSFGVTDCDNVEVVASNSSFKKFSVSHINNNICIDCDLIETIPSSESEIDMNEIDEKRVSVQLEIKKKLAIDNDLENSKILLLKTDAKLSHVIVQPPNYSLLKRQISNKNKLKSGSKRPKYSGKCFLDNNRCSLNQTSIKSFLDTSRGNSVIIGDYFNKESHAVAGDVAQAMSKNIGFNDYHQYEKTARYRNSKNDTDCSSPKSLRHEVGSSRRRTSRQPNSEIVRVQSANTRAEYAPSKKTVDSLHFPLPDKIKSNRTTSPKSIPYFKIVAGTHFAVDAFSYGEIPNVKHYFLTHFHSDHYAGLRKSFNKKLLCSKITGNLCTARLGVNPNCITILNIDEMVKIDGVEVTAVDANHCPGALMLVFTLPNGRTILHTGDFRACPEMESYPIFWNKEFHTVYLDTTYCNPRYDFPTQDQSLEMALYFLRQKKINIEKDGKKFSNVLIVCGTYTIGKEKFFLAMARRVGCSVWACPEKDKVLQAVEGSSFSLNPPHECQLHVVPMRDITHEKLKMYLDNLQGAFTEAVAFKPSGWENGKNSTVVKDSVTIHGIPYSEHSSFSELIRFVKFLKPKKVVPTVDITGGVKAVQKHFPCPLVCKDDMSQMKVTDFFNVQSRQHVPAVT